MMDFETVEKLLLIWSAISFIGGVFVGAIIAAGRSGGEDRINRRS